MNDEEGRTPGDEGRPAGFPRGLGQIMEQAKRLQERLTAAQAEFARQTAVGEAGGGMVRVTANGRNEVVRVEIEREVIDPNDPEMLQDLVQAATNQALKAVQRLVAEEVNRLTGGLNIPGLF